MKFLKKWFEAFSWMAGINLIYLLISNETEITRDLIIPLIIIATIFAIIPETMWDKVKIQLEKDMQ